MMISEVGILFLAKDISDFESENYNYNKQNVIKIEIVL